MVVCGMGVYLTRYIEHGKDWALYFSRENSGATGQLTDFSGKTGECICDAPETVRQLRQLAQDPINAISKEIAQGVEKIILHRAVAVVLAFGTADGALQDIIALLQDVALFIQNGLYPVDYQPVMAGGVYRLRIAMAAAAASVALETGLHTAGIPDHFGGINVLAGRLRFRSTAV